MEAMLKHEQRCFAYEMRRAGITTTTTNRQHEGMKRLFELLHEVGILKILGHIVVETRDDLVDRLLPRLFRILVLLQ